MNINKQYLFIVTGAFILGVIFSFSIVMVALWSYRLGRSERTVAEVDDRTISLTPSPGYLLSEATPLQTFSPASVPYVTVPSPVEEKTPEPVATAVEKQEEKSDEIDPAVKEEVREYMYSVNNILLSNKRWSDPNQFAQQLLTSTLDGDTSGLKTLINDYYNTRKQLMALNPPSDCRAYHNGCTELIGQGIYMLESVKGGIETQDINGLLSVQTQAASMEEEARRVDAMAKEIYEKYGIPEPPE